MLTWCTTLAAQTPPPPSPATAVEQIRTAEPSGGEFTLTFFNRPIVTLRARVLGREPSERAISAVRTLDDLVDQDQTSPIEVRPLENAALIVVGGRAVIALVADDADALAGETAQSLALQSASRLQQAIAEANEARAPSRILRSAASGLTGLAVGVLLLIGISRMRRTATGRLTRLAEESIAKSTIADVQLLHASRLIDWERRLILGASAALYLTVTYTTLTFVLRQFPFTRPWGEAMSGFLLSTAKDLSLGVAQAVPNLFTIAVILVIARFLIRLIGLWFTAIERGRIACPSWLHPETAVPTRRLLTAFGWVATAVIVYPYVPGSQTDAFKGVSVLLGVMVTLGSSGLVSQIVGNFMITYSRSLRVGDFVRIGDVEGTVTALGMLSTKVRSIWGEEVTIPNAVVISQTTMDFSRPGEAGGVMTPVSVTIGYDAPWRQVHSLLVLAAARTAGVRHEPTPNVLQTALHDFYVQYTLLVCLERQESKPFTMAALHAHIQDLFNEYGVQIMSPHYLGDPASPKVVNKQNWFAAPADTEAGKSGADESKTTGHGRTVTAALREN